MKPEDKEQRRIILPYCEETGKVRFPSKREAQTKINRISRRRKGKSTFRAYACEHCNNGWHLTHDNH